MNPFDVVKAINNNQSIEIDEKKYPCFIVNRTLSYFSDTVLYANEINRIHYMDGQLKFDFYINTIRKRNRFSKWHKQVKNEDLNAVKEYFGYSNEKAQAALKVLSDIEIKHIVEKVRVHGKQ